MSEANPSQHEPAGAPPPGVGPGGDAFDKSGVLREYAARFHVKTLVETGLYGGRGSGMHVPVETYVAIDYQVANLNEAERICPGGVYLLGDSAEVLPRVLGNDELAPPVLFWLDAHAIDDEEPSPTKCPLTAELAAIGAWEYAPNSVVLIDDLWAMGRVSGWPTLLELRKYARDHASVWECSEEGGIMRLTPRP